MSCIVITGASGFIGRAATRYLASAGYDVRPILRQPSSDKASSEKGSPDVWLPAGIHPSYVSDLTQDAGLLGKVFADASMVVHLADNPQRAHSEETGSELLAKAVGRAAASAGVPRVIFASSIYATFDEQGAVNTYGAGKRRAEAALAGNSSFSTIILRLPPVYGPGSKGAIALLAKLVLLGIPVPLGAATALRDYLSINNLTGLFAALAGADEATIAGLADTIWEPSDGASLATRDLVEMIGAACGRPARLVGVPRSLLSVPAGLLGKSDQVDAAFAQLTCRDMTVLQQQLGWRPSGDVVENLSYLGAESI